MENNMISEIPKALSGLNYDSYKAANEIEIINKNFNKSFRPINNIKKKKIKLTKLGKSTLVIATVLVMAPTAVTAIKHLPALTRNNELKDAQNYVFNELMPEILEEKGYKLIEGESGISYVVDFSKDDYYIIKDALVEKGLSEESAKYIIFEYFHYDENLFHEFGCENAEEYFDNAGYKSKDSWDANSIMVYENMHEVEFVENITEIKNNVEAKDGR